MEEERRLKVKKKKEGRGGTLTYTGYTIYSYMSRERRNREKYTEMNG